jgi:hypothetical protein
MTLGTYLVNDTKKECLIIGNDYPDKVNIYLLELEKYSKWDLRLDNIYISYTARNYYKDVKDKVYNRNF